MKHILKKQQNEPESLRQFRESTPNATYAGLHGTIRQELRDAICHEQGFICAYCMGRIKPTNHNMELEHFIPQNPPADSPYPPEFHLRNQLNFYNLLGTCNGNRSCSNFKGNQILALNPLEPNCESQIRFLKDGTAVGFNPRIQEDIVTLRLHALKDARKEIIDKARTDLLKKYPNKSWNDAILLKEIKRWKSLKNTRFGLGFEPYCMAAVNYLEGKLKHNSK